MTGVEFNCPPGATYNDSDVTLESKSITSVGLSSGIKNETKRPQIKWLHYLAILKFNSKIGTRYLRTYLCQKFLLTQTNVSFLYYPKKLKKTVPLKFIG